MAGELTKIERTKGLQGLLEKAKPAIEQALPKTLTTDKFMRVVLTSLRVNPKLAECTPPSFISCVLQAAQLGLTVDGVLGHAYLIPFYNRGTDTMICTLVPGYKGLVELALRSNMVSMVEAAVVFEGDNWTYERGLAPKLVHVPVETTEPGAMRLAYAIATMKDGTKRGEVVFAREIAKIKNFSQTGRKDVGPWHDWEEEMWKKTAIRRLCKLLPLSPEDRRLIELDEMTDAGKPIDMSEVVELPVGLAIAADEADYDSGGKERAEKTRLDAATATLASKIFPAITALAEDIDTKIQVAIDNIGEERIAGWLFVKYGIGRMEDVHKLAGKDKLELWDDLDKGRAEIVEAKPAPRKKRTSVSPNVPPELFDAPSPAPGDE